MRTWGKCQVPVLLCAILCANLGAQSAKLAGSDLMLEDNTLDVHLGADGRIDFIKATFYPGEGICNIYSLDIAKSRYEIHGQGVATSESIIVTGPESFLVKSQNRLNAKVTIEAKGIIMVLGEEQYGIRKKDGVFEIEVRPLLSGSSPDPATMFSYRLTLLPTPGFVGIGTKTYVPVYKFSSPRAIDSEATYVPKRLNMEKGKLTAYSYAPEETKSPQFQYVYQFPFSPDKKVNLDNYLILLTQRQADGIIPLIHPVLLTIYFYDAIMP